MSDSLRKRARESLDQLRRELLAERCDAGHWVGQLSPSALSTATAVSAMSALLIHGDRPGLIHGDRPGDSCDLFAAISKGADYLARSQNADGGFGDTDRSHSNVATSYLVLAASTLARHVGVDALSTNQTKQLEEYLDRMGGLDALRRRYGTDKTFVVPILTNLAIADLVSWDDVPALPFEAAVFPQSMYRLLRMPVVSYAIPALVAIGQARHVHGRKALFPLRAIRAASVPRTMRVLQRMQPESGGYLEATPLTSFVVMSLAATGRCEHDVSRCGLKFLINSMNEDGSWPIDTNLATWVTSLAVHALASDPDDDGSWCSESLVRWHLSCQHRYRHPFTGAEPGGWGWSDLSGAVPDGDDTPGAILACRQFRRWVSGDLGDHCEQAIQLGLNWLRRLQNSDGGWPTFCRGWGKLPFDRSSNDLTAHAMRALASDNSAGSARRQLQKASSFLRSSQQHDGSWLPLWFGNQDRVDEDNPVYGTSRVLLAAAMGLVDSAQQAAAWEYLLASQNRDGGWGGGPSVPQWLNNPTPGEAAQISVAEDQISVAEAQISVAEDQISSVEESALAVESLATIVLSGRNVGPERRNPDNRAGVESDHRNHKNRQYSVTHGVSLDLPLHPPTGVQGETGSAAAAGNDAITQAIIRGVEFLLGCVDRNRHRDPWPIGFYFAKLWYHERLYPLIFTTTALGKYLRATADDFDPDWPR